MKDGIIAVIIMLAMVTLMGIGNTAPKVSEKTVTYNAEGTVLKGYLAYSENMKGKRPGVLVVPEWWGLNDYARMRARMLAELGYTALAVDMYGDGRVGETPQEATQLSSEVMSNFEVGKARFLAAMDLIKSQPTVDPLRIAAIGYCFGGGVVLNMARQSADLKGVVSFHGSLTAVRPATPGSVKAKILVLQGDADKFVPAQQIEQFQQEMKAAGADFKVILYPGAMHSFTNPEADNYAKEFNMPIGYNASADRKSWNEMKKFLKEIFKK